MPKTELEVNEVPHVVDVDDVVQELRRLYCSTGLGLTVAIGKVVLERIFGGDSRNWRARSRRDSSFRRLEHHPDLPFGASTLSRAVQMFLLSQRHPILLELENLGPSHIQELLPLREDLQDSLLLQANEERWSVDRIRDERRRLRSSSSRRRGQLPEYLKGLRRLQPWLLERRLLSDCDQIERLTADDAKDLLAIAQKLCQQAQELAGKLARHPQLRAKEVPELRETDVESVEKRPSGFFRAR